MFHCEALFGSFFLFLRLFLFRLSVELLLVGLHVHVTLQLGAGGTDLEAELAVGGALVQLGQALHAAVLHRVLETSGEVRNELVDRSGA
jgi:hypothetical protein